VEGQWGIFTVFLWKADRLPARIGGCKIIYDHLMKKVFDTFG
jgi:hypothetical protein